MNIYEKYLSFIKEPDQQNEIFEEIVLSISPLIKKNVVLVDKNYQDDFQQELLLKLFDILSKQKFRPIFFKNINYNNKRFEFIRPQDKSLLSKFIHQSLENQKLYKSITSKDDFQKFINTFTSFIANVKLLNFLNKCFRNLKTDFLRKNSRESFECFDEEKYYNYEPINRGPKSNSIKTIKGISNKEREFLNHFIGRKTMLTQKEVANKLRVSQQYI